MIYSGINNYCATEDVKYQMDNSYTRLCTTSLDVDQVKEMVNLGNAEILEIEYSDKLTWLKVKSNGHIYTLQDNAMVEADLEKPEVVYSVGDLLKVQVSDSETQNIYVLEVNGDEIVGILDRNLPGGTVAWISTSDYNSAGGNWSSDSDEVKNQNLYEFGPITANKALNERTSSWNKVNKIEMPTMAKMLKLTEFYQNLSESEKENWGSRYYDKLKEFNSKEIYCYSSIECRKTLEESGYGVLLLPEWATINLITNGDNNAWYGYWVSMPTNLSDTYDFSYAFNVDASGYIRQRYVTDFEHIGVRPVIHIHESNILEKLEAPEYVNPDDVGGKFPEE